jgi:tripartite-type tricarboxylate transporter receptor subunit TctC
VLRNAMAKVVTDPGFRTAIAPDEPLSMSLAEFDAFLKSENSKWERLVRESGATTE